MKRAFMVPLAFPLVSLTACEDLHATRKAVEGLYSDLHELKRGMITLGGAVFIPAMVKDKWAFDLTFHTKGLSATDSRELVASGREWVRFQRGETSALPDTVDGWVRVYALLFQRMDLTGNSLEPPGCAVRQYLTDLFATSLADTSGTENYDAALARRLLSSGVTREGIVRRLEAHEVDPSFGFLIHGFLRHLVVDTGNASLRIEVHQEGDQVYLDSGAGSYLLRYDPLDLKHMPGSDEIDCACRRSGLPAGQHIAAPAFDLVIDPPLNPTPLVDYLLGQPVRFHVTQSFRPHVYRLAEAKAKDPQPMTDAEAPQPMTEAEEPQPMTEASSEESQPIPIGFWFELKLRWDNKARLFWSGCYMLERDRSTLGGLQAWPASGPRPNDSAFHQTSAPAPR